MLVKITFYNTSQYKIAVFVHLKKSSFKNGSAYDCSIYIGLISVNFFHINFDSPNNYAKVNKLKLLLFKLILRDNAYCVCIIRTEKWTQKIR